MKKIITLLIVVITALYFHSRTSKVAENGDLFEIRRALSGEQFGPFDTSEKLYIIVGIDYIPFELIELFREITGIKVVVDIFDSNEILESKLLAGNARYDLVFPTAWPHFSRQLNAKIYQPLDKNRIKSNIFYKDIMEKLGRWYDIQVFYQNPEVKSMRFTGNIDRYEDVRMLLGKLEKMNVVSFSVKGNCITVRKNK